MRALLIAAVVLCIEGCMPLPRHYDDLHPSRENMDAPLREKFPAPGTTREEVLRHLGAPDEAVGESRLVYRWRKVVGAIGNGAIVATYALEIEFDAGGAVTFTRER
jgi:hypothetical protein